MYNISSTFTVSTLFLFLTLAKSGPIFPDVYWVDEMGLEQSVPLKKSHLKFQNMSSLKLK